MSLFNFKRKVVEIMVDYIVLQLEVYFTRKCGAKPLFLLTTAVSDRSQKRRPPLSPKVYLYELLLVASLKHLIKLTSQKIFQFVKIFI